MGSSRTAHAATASVNVHSHNLPGERSPWWGHVGLCWRAKPGWKARLVWDEATVPACKGKGQWHRPVQKSQRGREGTVINLQSPGRKHVRLTTDIVDGEGWVNHLWFLLTQFCWRWHLQCLLKQRNTGKGDSVVFWKTIEVRVVPTTCRVSVTKEEKLSGKMHVTGGLAAKNAGNILFKPRLVGTKVHRVGIEVACSWDQFAAMQTLSCGSGANEEQSLRRKKPVL